MSLRRPTQNISRTCRHTDISSRYPVQGMRMTALHRVFLAACCLIMAACSAPSIAPIGVLAPFEGLYRRSGYAALDAVRSEIDAATGSRVGLLPFALDTSRDASRAMEKMRVTGTKAVVGPLTPQDGSAGATALAGIPWFAPWAVSDDGFEDPAEGHWLSAQIEAVAEDAKSIGVRSLVAAGWEGAQLAEMEGELALPLTWADSPLAVRSGDGVLWMGDAAGAARFVSQVRDRLPGTPVWLAPWAVDPVFVEHLRATGFSDWSRLYWITWLDREYAVWAAAHKDGTPFTYLTEQAARQAIASVTGAPLPAQVWQLHIFEVAPTGESVPASR